MVLAPTRVFEAFFLNPGGDQPVFFESPGGDRVTAWFIALLGVWNIMRFCMVVSVGVLVAGARVGVWWLWVSRVLVTVLFENCIVDASIFFFDAIL